MEVKYTNSWASFDLEKEAADALISDGCVLDQPACRYHRRPYRM